LKPIPREEVQSKTNEELIELVKARMAPYVNAGKTDEQIIHKGSPKYEQIFYVYLINFVLWKVFRCFTGKLF
jgi:alpha-N-acetylglucosamine transferase